VTTPSDRPARFSDEARFAKLNRAKTLLRQPTMSSKEAYDLAEALKGCNEFGYARKLFGRIRAADFTDLKDKAVKIGQRHALCTYKDTDLAAANRFKRALEILDEVDQLQCEPSQRQETLGLRGAIYKRMWQVEGQRKDLLRSLAYYLKGFEIGPATDQGYTGINAAFVFDLLAREEAIEAEVTGTRWSVADDYWRNGRAIRVQLAELLPGLPDQRNGAWLRNEWWFSATLAEAMFGIGQFDGAVRALRGFNRENGLDHEDPPLEVVSPWEFESTISQLGTLAELQANIIERLSRVKDWKAPEGFSADAISNRARDALRAYLGKYAAGVDRAFNGKLGLALSGGGFRASLFHIGVLRGLPSRTSCGVSKSSRVYRADRLSARTITWSCSICSRARWMTRSIRRTTSNSSNASSRTSLPECRRTSAATCSGTSCATCECSCSRGIRLRAGWPNSMRAKSMRVSKTRKEVRRGC
jgi:hypothetical protein